MLQSYKKTLTSNPSIPIFSSAMHKGAGLGADIYLIIYIGGVASAFPSAGGVAWGRMASRVVCSYIKPQHDWVLLFALNRCISSVSYIKPQHDWVLLFALNRCISSVSYIKPQLAWSSISWRWCCISSVSYIKPQQGKLAQVL